MRRTNRVILIGVLVLAASIPAMAELCGKCKGRMYIMSVGKCVECGGFAGSGAFKLCKACSAKLGQCEHCRALLKAPPKPDQPDQPAKIDTTKSGVYKSGTWLYDLKVFDAKRPGRYGHLHYEGIGQRPSGLYNAYMVTPWGKMYFRGWFRHFGGTQGWHLAPQEGRPVGKQLQPVGKVVSQRIKRLKANAREFQLDLRYHGDQDKPFYRFRLTTAEERPATYPAFWLVAYISPSDARTIIDHLAWSGALARMRDVTNKRLAFPKGPAYTLEYYHPKLRLYEVVGWDLEMLHRLEGLRGVLPEGPAKQMDKLLGRMAGHRLKWAGELGRKQAAADIKAGKAQILYYGKPWSADKPLVDEATRLPVEVMAGCTVTEEFVARVDAYNSAIRKWVKDKTKTPKPK